MPDPESRPQVPLLLDHRIQLTNIPANPRYQCLGRTTLLHPSRKFRRIHRRLYRQKRKPPPQRIIHHRQRSIRCIHRPDEIQILRQVKLFLRTLGIRQRDCMLRPALVRLNQHQQFPENLRKIAPVDLINNEEPIPTRIVTRQPHKLMQHPIPALQPRTARPEPLHEILIPVARMKLHRRHPPLISLTHQRKRQTPSHKRFPNPWRPLQDQCLLPPQTRQHPIQRHRRHEQIR